MSGQTQKRSISAKESDWAIADSLVDERRFKSVSEVVREGIRLVRQQTSAESAMMRDEDFDRRVLASLERIRNGTATMYTSEQVDANVEKARQAKRRQS